MTEIIRRSRPFNILLSGMTYMLGTGIAAYLGVPFSIDSFWLGLVWTSLIQLSYPLLAEVFRPVSEPAIENDSLRDRINLRNTLLLLSCAALISAAILTLIMLRADMLNSMAALFMGLFLVVSLAYAVPPLRLIYTGFGEFTLAILLANLPASTAFSLQSGEYHRLVGYVTFPLILLGLAWLIVLEFRSFSTDQKYEHQTLLSRIGWERAVPFHHAMVAAAYLGFLGAPLMGIGFSLIWPAFLTLPFSLLQILLVRGIALGGRPNWNLLTVNSTAVFGLTIYFITLTFWIR